MPIYGEAEEGVTMVTIVQKILSLFKYFRVTLGMLTTVELRFSVSRVVFEEIVGWKFK